MGRVESAETRTAGAGTPGEPPGIRIWHAIESTPQALIALEKGKKGYTRSTVLQEYLTTGKTQMELLPLARVRSSAAIHKHLSRSMEIVYPHLPQELREEYPTPEQALRARSGTRTQSEPSRERIRKAVTRRWQRYREVEKPQGIPAFSEQGLENIKQGRRNRARKTTNDAIPNFV